MLVYSRGALEAESRSSKKGTGDTKREIIVNRMHRSQKAGSCDREPRYWSMISASEEERCIEKGNQNLSTCFRDTFNISKYDAEVTRDH